MWSGLDFLFIMGIVLGDPPFPKIFLIVSSIILDDMRRVCLIFSKAVDRDPIGTGPDLGSGLYALGFVQNNRTVKTKIPPI